MKEGLKLPIDKVKAARHQEVSYTEGRGIWEVRPVEERWRVPGKAPVSTRCLYTDKGFMTGEMLVRSSQP